MATLPAAEIRRAVRQGLEDLAQGDATTAAPLISGAARAEIIAQQPLVVVAWPQRFRPFIVDPSRGCRFQTRRRPKRMESRSSYRG